MDIKANKLYCDNNKCKNEYDIPEDAPLEQLIDMPCPKCGENLLTADSYEKTIALETAGIMVEEVGLRRSIMIADALKCIERGVETANQVLKATNGETGVSIEFNTNGPISIREYKLVKTEKLINQEFGNNNEKV